MSGIYAEIADADGGKLRVQRSIQTADPCVWLLYEGRDLVAFPQLDYDQARRLRNALDEFLKEQA